MQASYTSLSLGLAILSLRFGATFAGREGFTQVIGPPLQEQLSRFLGEIAEHHSVGLRRGSYRNNTHWSSGAVNVAATSDVHEENQQCMHGARQEVLLKSVSEQNEIRPLSLMETGSQPTDQKDQTDRVIENDSTQVRAANFTSIMGKPSFKNLSTSQESSVSTSLQNFCVQCSNLHHFEFILIERRIPYHVSFHRKREVKFTCYPHTEGVTEDEKNKFNKEKSVSGIQHISLQNITSLSGEHAEGCKLLEKSISNQTILDQRVLDCVQAKELCGEIGGNPVLPKTCQEAATRLKAQDGAFQIGSAMPVSTNGMMCTLVSIGLFAWL